VRQHITAMCSSEWDRATLASRFGKLLSPGRGLAAGAPIRNATLRYKSIYYSALQTRELKGRFRMLSSSACPS